MFLCKEKGPKKRLEKTTLFETKKKSKKMYNNFFFKYPERCEHKRRESTPFQIIIDGKKKNDVNDVNDDDESDRDKSVVFFFGCGHDDDDDDDDLWWTRGKGCVHLVGGKVERCLRVRKRLRYTKKIGASGFLVECVSGKTV